MTGSNGSPRGAWLSFDDSDGKIEALRVHSSELKALRDAVQHGGKAVFVEFGQSLSEALTAGAEKQPLKQVPTARPGKSTRVSDTPQ